MAGGCFKEVRKAKKANKKHTEILWEGGSQAAFLLLSSSLVAFLGAPGSSTSATYQTGTGLVLFIIVFLFLFPLVFTDCLGELGRTVMSPSPS